MDNLLEKFSQNLKNVLKQSIEIAKQDPELQVTPLHLFQALLLEKNAVVYDLLKNIKLKKKSFKKNKKNLLPKISSQTKKIITYACLLASRHNNTYVGTEHLLQSLADNIDLSKDIKKILADNKIKSSELSQSSNALIKRNSRFPEMLDFFKEPILEPDLKQQGFPINTERKITLDFFATNLTRPDIAAKLDPVIARDNEINRLIQILARRYKNNPVLLGDPGVGKTAIVEGLAKKIWQKDVPQFLIDKKIFALDMGAIVAGTAFRGEFESRLKQIIDEISKDPDIIIFIDELHTIIGAGAASGSMDAANILKPALSRGKIRCIGATTYNEYKKHIEQDPALERRFQSININEPDIKQAIAMLQGVVPYYENYHQIKISPEVINQAVKLSSRYIFEKSLPDKAIDLIDEAAAKVKINKKEDKDIIKFSFEIKNKLDQIEKDLDQAMTNLDFDKAINLKDQIQQLKLEIAKKREDTPLITDAISADDINQVISQITNIPLNQLKQQEKDYLLNLENTLTQKIIGQDQAIKIVSNTLRRASSGLSSKNRPLASFVFLGPSGVGKTELAKILATTFFHSKDALIKIDMSEFAESFNVSRLLGSPAGYVGYKEGGTLTESVRRHPYSVVLFDEIEKAHPHLLNILLQILEDGHLTDAAGKKVNFANTIIILTSNIGSDKFFKNNQLGFGFEQEKENYQKDVFDQLKNFFKPELLNRLDNIIVFNKLQKDHLEKIVSIQSQELLDKLDQKNIKIKLSLSLIKHLAGQAYKPQQGARAVRKIITEKIENELAILLLNDKIKDSDTLKIDFKKDKIIFDY